MLVSLRPNEHPWARGDAVGREGYRAGRRLEGTNACLVETKQSFMGTYGIGTIDTLRFQRAPGGFSRARKGSRRIMLVLSINAELSVLLRQNEHSGVPNPLIQRQ